VVLDGGRMLVVSQRRAGAHAHYALPGGRIGRGESVTDAIRREFREEVDFDVEPLRLLYVAEVTPPHGEQDLNLIFLAEPAGALGTDLLDSVVDDHAPGRLVDLAAPGRIAVLPPILPEIVRDHADGWRGTPRWLGNVWRERPGAVWVLPPGPQPRSLG
jgi:8-oxo-dGTP pyrophosphatase MutT (NUDIX family)